MKLMAAGDQVLVAEFGDRIDEAVNDQVHALAAKIEEQQIPGIGEVVPTFRSLLIYYDSYQLSYREAAGKIEELARNLKTEQKTKKRILKIPCCYGARFGPDLADMEQLTGLDRKEMIDIHSSVDYKVYMLGFLPGFAYLGGLDERIHVPRLKSPRLKISRGAVGIGGSQTGIYPMDSPGGLWERPRLTCMTRTGNSQFWYRREIIFVLYPLQLWITTISVGQCWTASIR